MRSSSRNSISIFLGVVVGFFLPLNMPMLSTFLKNFSQLFYHITHYVVYPFFFFSLAISIGLLRRDQLFSKFSKRIVIWFISSGFIMSLLGVLLAIVLPLDRIPINFERENISPILGISDLIAKLIPINSFSLFSGTSLLAILIMAVVLGYNFSTDREVAAPTYNIFDSLNRIFYSVLVFMLKKMVIPMFIFTVSMIYDFRQLKEIEVFNGLLQVVFVSVLVVGFVLFSVFYAFITDKKYFNISWVYALFPNALFSFVSPSFSLSCATFSVMSHQNKGLKRNYGAFLVPIYALFGRSGMAFINSIALIVILKSYNSLDITLSQILLAVLVSFVSIFLVPDVLGNTLVRMLTISCLLFQQNLEAGVLILEPILPMLSSIGHFLDMLMLILMLSSFSVKEPFMEHKIKREFI